MGIWLSNLLDLDDNKIHARFLIVGLDGAGKTAILYKLKCNEIITTLPKTSVNVEDFETKEMTFTVWDVAGKDRVRPVWRHYYENSDGLIFVVDSANRERVKDAAEELHKILDDDLMHDVPVLVFANKMDLPTAMSENQLIDSLRLQEVQRNKWSVQQCSAITGHGLSEGLQRIVTMVYDSKKKCQR